MKLGVIKVNLVSLILLLLTGLSIIITFVSLFYAVIKRSWKAMLVCFIASMPISMYFLSVNPPMFLLGFIPIILLVLTFFLRKHSGNEIVH